MLNNPYGTDLLLGELIPSTSIGQNSATLFNAGASASTAGTDTIGFLQPDGSWKTFFYDSSSPINVSAMHVIGVRRPLDSDVNATTMTSDDFYIGNGDISTLQSCTDAAGSNTLSNSNDGNYTKLGSVLHLV